MFTAAAKGSDAPETSTSFQKKLMFAQVMLEVGAVDAAGLDPLERQLMGFYLKYHITDTHY